MGTNYHAKITTKPACPTCGHTEIQDRLHIGKSSAGWCFSLHVIPEHGLTSWETWDAFLRRPDVMIVDEYDRSVTADDMTRIVSNRKWYRDATLSPEWMANNNAIQGPNGLARHATGPGSNCIAHGEGTWDLIVGWFR
jgi:hypothetical protein